MKHAATQSNPKPAVVSLAQLLAEQPAAPPPGWIEPGLLPPQGILFVGGEPKVGKSLLVANLALALAAGKDRSGLFPAWRRCAERWERPPTKTCGWTPVPAATCSARRKD